MYEPVYLSLDTENPTLTTLKPVPNPGAYSTSSPAYNIKVTKANGDIENYFIDAENFVILKVTSNIKIQGNESEGESLSGNYKEVNGVLLPFTIENKSKGQTVSHFIVDKYEINTEINDSIFIKPVKK